MKARAVPLTLIGILLLASALCLTGVNLQDERRAGRDIAQILSTWSESPDPSGAFAVSAFQHSDTAMPTVEIGGASYIGRLSLPDAVLPILAGWNDLTTAPGRFSGSVSDKNLVIAGHNYRAHFGSLTQLSFGDAVSFTGVDGHRHRYQVTGIDVIAGTDRDGILAGDWHLTMFTCTFSGTHRLAVRCRCIP